MCDISLCFPSQSLQHAGCSGARNQADNVSDLQAQIAANQKGILLVNELAREFGVGVVKRWEEGGVCREFGWGCAVIGSACAR